MPSIPQSELPPPKSWDDFEDLVCALKKQGVTSDSCDRFGRAGQRQNGVDIFFASHAKKQLTGIQCKRYEEGTLTTAKIESEVADAEGFTPKLTHYIIATTDKRDAKTQSWLLQLNQSRAALGQFSISLETWETISAALCESANRSILMTFYGDWIKGFEVGIEFGKSAIADYIKRKIDRAVLSALLQTQKIYYAGHSSEELSRVLLTPPQELSAMFLRKKTLGFFLFKKWDASTRGIEDILEDPLIANQLSDNQMGPLARLHEALIYLDTIPTIADLFDQAETEPELKLLMTEDGGTSSRPDRILLVRPVGREGSARVENFGDFRCGDIPLLLNNFSPRPNKIKQFLGYLESVVTSAREWVELSGGQFIPDPRSIRIARHNAGEPL